MHCIEKKHKAVTGTIWNNPILHQPLKKEKNILLLSVAGVAHNYHFDITGSNSVESLSL